jgi:hypothetical protein
MPTSSFDKKIIITDFNVAQKFLEQLDNPEIIIAKKYMPNNGVESLELIKKTIRSFNEKI